MKKFIFILVLSCFLPKVLAQDTLLLRRITYSAELGTFLSSNGNTPFWVKSNQYGIAPRQSAASLQAGVVSGYREDRKKDWGFGASLVGNIGKNKAFLIPELYIKGKIGHWEAYIGRRKEVVGLVDSTLSSGSYIWSGNALPMPKIQISIPNYMPIGFTKGLISIKGSLAHGWFENSRSDVKNFYLHQKTFYLRIGKPNWKMKFYGGFNHQVQWGGELKYPDPDNYYSKNGKLPSSFKDFLSAVTGQSLAVESDTTKFGFVDAGNRAGNHLGTVDLGFEINTQRASILVYRQNIYEDGSLFYLINITDGLNGISITTKNQFSALINIKKIVFEFLNTYSQGGSTGAENTNSNLRGLDNYLNHGQYRDGWSYDQFGIGTPFVVASRDIRNLPSFPTNFFSNNRVQAFYLGLQTSIYQRTSLNLRLSYSRNIGTYDAPYATSIGQFSGGIKMITPLNILPNCELSTAIGYDNNGIYQANFGGYVGIRKVW